MNKITQIIDKYILQENYYFLNRVFKQAIENNDKKKAKEILKAAFNSRLIKNEEALNAQNYSDFWNFLSANFLELSLDEKNTVIELIIKIRGYNYQNSMAFFSIVNQYYYIENHTASIDEKLAAWKPIFSWGLDEELINKIQDNEVYLIWILFILSDQNNLYQEELIISEFPIIYFNNVELESKITTLLNNIDFYSPIKEILEYEIGAQLLFLLLKERKLDLESLANDSFYKTKIVQKLFVHLDNMNVKYPEIVKKIQKEIDYTDKIFGSELNLFLENHPEIVANNNVLDEYTDGFSAVRSFDVVNKAFINDEGLKELSVEKIIEILKVSLKDYETMDSNTIYILGVEGQNEALTSFFETNHKKGEEIVEELLQNENLVVAYSQAISTFLQKNLSEKEMIRKYIYAVEKDNIKHETYKIFKALTKINSELVYEYIRSLDYHTFEEQFIKGIDDEQFIDINYFINSNFGKFYEMLRECIINIDNGESILNSYINKIRNPFLKQYVRGMFFEFFANDGKEPTFNNFQGMSHYYKIGTDGASFYKDIVKEVLLTGTKDSFLKENILFTMIFEIVPDSDIDVSKINYDFLQSLLPEMFRAYLQSVTINENIYNWLIEIIKKTELCSNLMEFIMRSCYKCNVEGITRIVRILKEIENYKLPTSKNIELYSIKYEVEKFNNDITILGAQNFDVFLKVINLIFKNNFIKIDYSSYKQIDKIMHITDQRKMYHRNKELLHHIQDYFPPTDYKALRRKYLKV